MQIIKNLKTYTAVAVALSLLSGCATQQANFSDCPRFYEVELTEPTIPPQSKRFRMVEFKKDSSLAPATAVCKFNNSDGSHVSKDVYMGNGEDIKKKHDNETYMYKELLKKNAKVKIHFGDSNVTKK